MIEYGAIVDAGCVQFQRLLPGPIERVWAYLTECERRGTWLAPGEMDLRLGGRVTLAFRHANLSPGTQEPTPERFKRYEAGHTQYGRITRLDPPRLLSYTWGGESDEDSEVTFELAPEGDQVRLTLTHRRLPDRGAMANVAGGWHTHLRFLSDQLEGRAPANFWSLFTTIEGEYERRFAATSPQCALPPIHSEDRRHL
jgi:uncharacterized protein YndB with AHSA1/START domain